VSTANGSHAPSQTAAQATESRKTAHYRRTAEHRQPSTPLSVYGAVEVPSSEAIPTLRVQPITLASPLLFPAPPPVPSPWLMSTAFPPPTPPVSLIDAHWQPHQPPPVLLSPPTPDSHNHGHRGQHESDHREGEPQLMPSTCTNANCKVSWCCIHVFSSLASLTHAHADSDHWPSSPTLRHRAHHLCS
jgi:hypothetical protein